MANLLSTTVNGQLNTGNVIDLGYTVNGSIATTAFRGINFHSFSDGNYLIGKRAGAWTQPLDITFYTGIKYHAHRAYGGHKFYTGGFDSDFALSIGDGDNLVRVADRIIVNGTMNVNYDQVWTSSGNLHLQYSSAGNIDMNYGGGYAFSRTSLRAPIFYDYNDTNYYVDPNGNSYLSTLRVADASSGVSLHVGVGSTHGVYTADNARKQLVVSGDYYPHMAIVATGSNNTNHGAVFSFVGTEGSSPRQWNLGISNQNPFLFSIGYNRTGDNNPHYGLGDGWSGDDNNHARLSIDRDGNTKIRGMLYVNGTSGGISTGNAVIHAGNIGSQSVSYASSAGNADTLDGYHSNTVGNRHHTARGFYVDGDQNTYYPVLIQGSGNYAFNRYSIYRFYGWEAPWDPIGTGAHKGGLTFDVEWSGDIAWGGNDKTLRVVQFAESYTTMVAGMALPVTGGLCVWLRGGHAYYEIQVDAYPNTPTVYLDGFTAANGAFYGPRADTSNVQSEIYNKMPVRGSSELYDGGSRVITSGNIGSQSVNYASSAGNSDTLDSLDSSEFARGRAAYQVLNLDTIKQPGLYQYDGGIGGTQPEGADQYNLRTIEIGSGGRYSQMAFDWASEQAWFRRQTGSTWSAWREFIHSGNIASQSVSYADESGFASSAGSVEWTSVQNKPATFPPSSHTHDDRYYTESESDGRFQPLENQRLSTSNGPTFANVYTAGWFRNYGNQGIYNESYGTHFYSNESNAWSITGSGGNVELQFRSTHQSTPRGWVYANTSNEIGFLSEDGNWVLRTWNRGVEAYGSMRAPIFYDSNDTAFYVDPNSSSRVRNLYVGDSGSNWVDTGGWGTQFHVSNGPHSILKVFARNEGIETGLFSHVGGQSKVGSFSNHDFSVVRNWDNRMTFYSGYTYANGYLQAADSLRAPIFYDSNDTGYYVDPNSISRLWGVAIRGDAASTGTSNQIFFWGAGDGTTSAIGFKANGGYFENPTGNGDGYNTYFTMDTPGRGWVFREGAGGSDFGARYTSGWILNNGVWQANASMRAPIFYDSEDTAYYLDPNSGSYLNRLTLSGSTHFYPNNWIEFPGHYGLYSGTNGAHFYPNNASYGSWRIAGSRNGWHGIHFDSGATLMMNGSETGVHREGVGWQWRWDAGTLHCHKGSSGGGTDAIVLDSSNVNSYAVGLSGDQHIYNAKWFHSDLGAYSGSLSGPSLQATSYSNNSAFMSFHRWGYYAVNMGLDQDNVFRIGGWSAAANRMQLDMSGNVTFAGDVTAFSDARVKENVKTIENALDKTLKLRGVSYNRIDSEDKSTKIGVIAQEILEIVPEVVNQDNDGMYNVSYGNITALLIEAIKEQQKQIEELKSIINGLTT